MAEKCVREKEEADRRWAEYRAYGTRSEVETLIIENNDMERRVEALEWKAKEHEKAGEQVPDDLARELEEARKVFRDMQADAHHVFEELERLIRAYLDADNVFKDCMNRGQPVIINVPCSLRWKDTAKKYDPENRVTDYTLELTLRVGDAPAPASPPGSEPGGMPQAVGVDPVDLDQGIAGKMKEYKWTLQGRAIGSRSWHSCSGSASFEINIMKLFTLRESDLRAAAENHVNYCDPFNHRFERQ